MFNSLQGESISFSAFAHCDGSHLLQIGHGRNSSDNDRLPSIYIGHLKFNDQQKIPEKFSGQWYAESHEALAWYWESHRVEIDAEEY